MLAVRHFAVSCVVFSAGARESGTGGVGVFVIDALACLVCISGASVSGKAVVIKGSEVT